MCSIIKLWVRKTTKLPESAVPNHMSEVAMDSPAAMGLLGGNRACCGAEVSPLMCCLLGSGCRAKMDGGGSSCQEHTQGWEQGLWVSG